jgi:hypothetical protein
MKAELAMMQNVDYGYISACDKALDGHKNYIRMTEFVEVEFPELPPEETVQLQIDALEREREKEITRHLLAVADIDERKSKLLAITHEPAQPEPDE